jgi:hypothetical protein
VEAIEVGLAKGRNAKAIWQDLVDVYGFTGGYQSVNRFIRKFRGQQSPEACAVIETAPGVRDRGGCLTRGLARGRRRVDGRRRGGILARVGGGRRGCRQSFF